MSAISRNIRSIVNEDGAVILDFEHDAMLTLNSTGAYVWERLERGMLIDQIVHEMAAETHTDLAIIDRDVQEFVSQLRARHLFRI